MLSSRPQYRVAWIGPECLACEDVLTRFVDTAQRLGFEADAIRSESLSEALQASPDRVVLVSSSRTDYPLDHVHFLTTHQHISPWGVVTDSWHIGSRRSGPGPLTHWQQPWFRWWDSWAGWFFPQAARPGSQATNMYAPIMTYADHASPATVARPAATDNCLAIVCACPRTASMLQQQSEHAGWHATLFHTITQLASATAEFEIILWDDSVLPCLPSCAGAGLLQEHMIDWPRIPPAKRFVASIDLEHLAFWPSLQTYGFSDLLIKPSYALALANLLYLHAHLETVNASPDTVG